jgi:uncharacterized membrane protein YgdD (TMEM256/DUF423 family)
MFVFWGALNGFVAVAFGAFGAHALKGSLDASSLAIYDTGARYHLTHAVVLLAVGTLPRAKLVRLSGWLFMIGMVVFSGSLYALAISGIRILGAITPLGGISLLAGWACLAAWALVRDQTELPPRAEPS